MLTLFFIQDEIGAYVFLGLIGVSNGLANVLGSSTWADMVLNTLEALKRNYLINGILYRFRNCFVWFIDR